MKKTYFNWSSGKDSALALYTLQQSNEYSVGHLITTVNSHYDRVSMHGLRRSVLERQFNALQLPFTTIELPESPDMDTYNALMAQTVQEMKEKGFEYAAFGDIFLEDLKNYREAQLNTLGMHSVFPLWKKNTTELMHEFIDLGFKTIVVATKSELLDASFVGRVIDHDFLNDLPESVDPCGEHGEFHTFCFDGPIFKEPVPFEIGEKTFREYENPSKDDAHSNNATIGFWFCDLL